MALACLLLLPVLQEVWLQATADNVSPGTGVTVTVTAVSSNFSVAVSRMVNFNESVAGPPTKFEGDAAGSNGILLTWIAPDADNILRYVIRYKEVCPYPDPTFTEVDQNTEAPEMLLNDLTSGSTYHIQVAALTSGGTGAYSKSLFIKTNESPPGLVTDLTAYSQNHTSVMVTWYLPRRINGLITKFAVKVKHARTSTLVQTLEINAEDIMSGALPHCNDAAEILSRATISPLEVTASSAPYTLSAVPPAASWSVPISTEVDQLRPYTTYLFEVSAFTSEGEGQVASTIVRMPESAPEDPPQNLSTEVTSRSLSVSWKAPTIITGRFTYVVYLYGPTGYLSENTTGDMQVVIEGLIPYTEYKVVVRAKVMGELGPPAEVQVLMLSEAPSAVQDLVATAEDAVSILVSWKSPAQPNGLIVQYRLQVLEEDLLVQDITLTSELTINTTDWTEEELPPPDLQESPRRNKRDTEEITFHPIFTPSVSEHGTATRSPASSHSASRNPDPTAYTHGPLGYHTVSEISFSTSAASLAPASAVSGTSPLSLTTMAPATPPSWLTLQSHPGRLTTDSSALTLTPNQPQQYTRNALLAGHVSTRSASTSGTTGVTVREEVVNTFSKELSYLVFDLNPFTEYTFAVTASTTVGEGPTANISEMTREQVPSSVFNVSYENINSTSIIVSWTPPLNPNGVITHYTVYVIHGDDEAQQWVTSNTSVVITGLEKYTPYSLRVAASTAAGQSSLSDEDDVFAMTLEDEPESPPKDLTVADTSPSTVTLTWSAPEKANGEIQQYEVLYENEVSSTVVNTSSTSITLMNLKPFSYYNVTVRAYTRLGHGNQTSDMLLVLSGEDVPGSPPYNLSYHSVSANEVNVTWQPPLVPNGVIKYYSLQLWNASHHLNLTSPTTSIHITHLRKYTHYRASVQAHTRVGAGNHSSDPLNITTLEDAPDTPPQFLHSRKLSDNEMELSWEPPLEANSEILHYAVRVWNDTTEQNHNVTETSVVVQVDAESAYNATVSTWTRLGDGGVLTHIAFSTADSEPLDPPQALSFGNVTASSVTMQWRPPTQPNGIIVHYSIYYAHNGTITEQRIPVSASTSTDSTFSYTLTGLIGGTNYTLWMTSSTEQGDGGVQTQPLSVLVPEDVPSDSVHNLSAQIFSSTVIIVSWDPPLQPNGRPHYLLTLQEAGDTQNHTGQEPGGKIIRTSTADTVYLFPRLRKYYPYIFTVTPATGAGPAHNLTSTLYLRTNDDIPSSSPLLVSSRNLSSSSVAVVWQRPLEANGEITEYTLTLSGPGGSNVTHTPNTSLVLTNLLPYTQYNVTITAATRRGSGPALLLIIHTDEGGPASPPRNLSIYNHTSFSVWLTWEPPLEPNGVITHYGFRIQELITHTVTHKNSSGPATTEYISYFRPHRSYEISVSSYTRVGNGDLYSKLVTFTTNESVSDEVRNLSCSGQSWESVRLTWEPPASPNGQILFYQIVMESDSRSLTQHAHASQHVVSGLLPQQQYTFTVIPVNSAGPGDGGNCTAVTLPESVPGAPRFLTVFEVTAESVTLQWASPLPMSGLLREYWVVAQLLSRSCDPLLVDALSPVPDNDLGSDCVDSDLLLSVNGSGAPEDLNQVTFRSLAKHRYYRFKVAAVTSVGAGEYTPWNYTHTLVGDPDYPPSDLRVTSSSNSLNITWDIPAVLTGPTSYLVQVTSLYSRTLNVSQVVSPTEVRFVTLTNLTSSTHYSVIVTAFTGLLANAIRDGKSSNLVLIQTKEEKPKDPPTNVSLSIIPDKVTNVLVTFISPPERNSSISSYVAEVYQHGKLIMTSSNLNITKRENMTVTAVIQGLKGGQTYTIRIAAINGAGRGPLSPEIPINTEIQAPPKPTLRPQAVLNDDWFPIVTHRSITIHMPACFYSDDNGPIWKIQVIVAESGVKDSKNLTNWRNAFFHYPAPYLTDEGFPNPSCLRNRMAQKPVYVIGESDQCVAEGNSAELCNGPLKPNTVYVFKFRATNTRDQYTDSDYSDHIKTASNAVLTRDEQIILGVLLSFFLIVLIIVICVSVNIRHRKEGDTYSPSDAEKIDIKLKLDQLIAVADLELKEDKLNRYSSFFFRRKEIYVIQLLSYRKSLKPVNKKSFLQHVEDLCANDNIKFQEEFAELPKLLQDLATSDADLPWNRSKNRFTNIKPYNNNRVKLMSEAGTLGSDYINASFVSGYLCPNEFIATQGPLPGTVGDFWRMIWETGTRSIAMLTQCYEKGRIRCHKYWPEDNKPLSVFGDIYISKLSEDVFPEWTVRTLKVERHGNFMVVHHFNYTSWPEHGVPESSSTLIQFVKAVRANRHENSTIAVHCSAGVGRTGVFIALDHLIQHVRDHDFVDVYGLVAELRSERMCMVQNLAQYMFLHQSTLDLLSSKGNSQSIWFVNYSALEKMDSLEAMEGDVELEWEETTM